MMLIETFSEDAWSTPNAVKWNYRTGRGILYRGFYRVEKPEAPYPCKHGAGVDITHPSGPFKGFAVHSCKSCGAVLKEVDSSD